MNYTDLPLIATYLKRSLTNEEIATLSVLVPAIERWIDKKLGTTFVKQDVATTRIFDGGGSSIDIDPCTGVTAVTSLDYDGSVSYPYNATEYILEPQNETVKTEVRLRARGSRFSRAQVQVTAKFSEWDGGVPQDVQVVVTKIAADIVSAAAVEAGAVSSESLEGHTVKYRDPNETIDSVALNDPTVKSFLDLRKQLLVD